MKNKTAKLAIVQTVEQAGPTFKDLEKETKSWRITREEAQQRVCNLRLELEDYRDQIDAVPYDILADCIPKSLDHSERRWSGQVMEEFNPLIKKLFERIDDCGQRHGCSEEMDFNAQLFELQTQLSETAFAIGILAGAIFSGASSEQVTRFERGLLYAVQTNPQLVK